MDRPASPWHRPEAPLESRGLSFEPSPAGGQARYRSPARLPFQSGLVALVLLYLGTLIGWPLAAILLGSVAEGPTAFLSALASPEVRAAFLLTARIAVIAVAVNGVFGAIVAWVLVRQSFRGRRLLDALVDLPFVVSPVIAGYMILLLFGRGGWFTPVTEILGIKVTFAFPAMVLATVFVTLPFVPRELAPVLEQIGTDPEMAARTLGASPWQAFRHVTLPAIRWALLYGLALTVARSFGEFGAVLVAGGAVTGRTETATLFIYRALDERAQTSAYAASVVLALATVSLLLAIDRMRSRSEVV